MPCSLVRSAALSVDLLALFERVGRIDDDSVLRVMPSSTSTLLPKSRPMVSFFKSILLSGPTTAAMVPLGRNSRALIGTRERWPETLASKCTCAYSPCSSVPVGLGTSTSVSSVRVAGIDGVGGAHHLAAEIPAREFGQLEAGFHVRHAWRRVGLRHGHVDAQRIGLRQIEHFACVELPPLPALISVPISTLRCGDDAGKRRVDALEGFQFLQALHVRLRRTAPWPAWRRSRR